VSEVQKNVRGQLDEDTYSSVERVRVETVTSLIASPFTYAITHPALVVS